jgi:hypothetical protein
LCLFSRTELLKAKGQLNVEVVDEGQIGDATDDGVDPFLAEAAADETGDGGGGDDDRAGHLGHVRNRRARSYSIKGDTGDVTDGRIVV